MDKTYDPKLIEQTWYAHWEREGLFAPRGAGAPYCIMLPPPNVTGTLHMGHAFQDTLMDVLIRFHGMTGHNTLWQAGTDHAGIATQMVVERNLARDNLSRTGLGREAFVERVWQWKAESGGAITGQMRRLGCAIDWRRERFTMDDGLSQAVREVFVRLYRAGIIYRGQRLVNWDPVLQTAVSDLEVESTQEQGHLWHLRYPLVAADGTPSDEHLIVATTRPETMLGDMAVAVHPEDERYRHLVGAAVALPLTERRIPVIADDYVDPEFGSGCVKITPAHDFNDYAVGKRHGLTNLNVFTPTGAINENGPAAYQGLDRFEARKRVVADLERAGLLERIDAHSLMVPRGDRSGAVIEPYLTDQWYVAVAPLARPAIEAVESGRIRFVPENWSKTYFEWMRNLEDWCISRQIWWGHRIPAWYDDDANIYVGLDEAEVRAHYALPAERVLHQDEDVLDTWFSSALWPFSTLGWPEQTDDLKTWYPTSVLVTGFDIIFFWVARMIMMGLHFMDDVPFREVYVHGLVRDSDGQKMSKSKGNVLDPLDLIDGTDLEALVTKRTKGLMQPQMAQRIEATTRKQFPEGIPAFGTDALRFTFAALATMGRDVRFDLGRVQGYRNFCNKLWNAARFVILNTEGEDTGTDASKPRRYSIADRWMRARLATAAERIRGHLAEYRFDRAAQEVYSLIWDDYCDWYLEFAKPTLQGAADDDDTADPVALQRGVRATLVVALETILRLLHPFMPFITEELWHRVVPLVPEPAAAGVRSISLRPYPSPAEPALPADPEAVAEIEWVQAVIMGVRRIRSEMDVPPGRTLPVLLRHGDALDAQRAERYGGWLRRLGRIERVDWLEPDADAPECATALVGDLQVLIPLAGLIDKDAEIARLTREIAKLDSEIARCQAKLGKPSFVERAPAEVVAQERARLADFEAAHVQLHAQLDRIRSLGARG